MLAVLESEPTAVGLTVIRKNWSSSLFIAGFVQVIAPVAPTAGVLQLQPAGGLIETKVEGLIESDTLSPVAVSEAGGLWTPTVYVRLVFTVTGLGEPEFVTERS